MKKGLYVLILGILTASLIAGSLGCHAMVKTYKWRMATSWTADNLFYTKGAQAICDKVNKLSGGRLIIEPSPAGKIVGAMDVMDAVSQGKVEMGHSWSGYWLDKDRTFELFSSIPDQMTAQEWLVWLYGPANGIALWQEQYASYHIIPFPGGLVGPEFGFFTKKPIRSLEDFQGLKLRVTGLAADVVEELGATTVLTTPGDIKSAMEKGEIDGFEFSTPAIDWPMDFQETAPYVSLPSWHQPSAMNETLVNQEAFNKLPDDLKAILESACKEVSDIDYFAAMEGANATYLSKYKQYGTQIITLDDEAVQKISDITNRLANEHAANNPLYAKVLASQRDFVIDYRQWEAWSDYKLYAKRDQTDKALAQVQEKLNEELGALTQELQSAAQKMSSLDMSGPEARSLLSGLLKDRPYIVDVSTVNRSAQLVAVEPVEFRSFEGQDIGDQTHIIRLFKTGQPVLSENFKAVEGFEAADLEYPIFNADKELIGSVSVLFKPDILLKAIITEIVDGASFSIWAMQPDGRVIYDTDPQEIGTNTFIDPLYQAFPQVLSLAKEITATQSGTGRYQFLDTGFNKTVNKESKWITYNLYGTEWRLILSREIP